jgi:hypothetical protein
MKKIIPVLTVVIVLFLLTSCASKKAMHEPVTTVRSLGEMNSVTDGSLIYALPMTVFRISVEMERTIEEPGPYARYASEMLGLKNVITNESEYWSIKSVSINNYDEVDPSEFYVIESNAIMQTNALALKKAGLVLDINPGVYGRDKSEVAGEESNLTGLEFQDLGANEYFITQRDTAYRLTKYDSVFIKIPYLVEKKKPLTLEQLADKAAKTLLELRDGIHLILTGEANVFPQSYASIDEINRLEKEYLALFAGKTLKEKKILNLTFIPEKDMEGKPVVLFSFSDLTGPAGNESASADSVTITLESAKKTRDITYIEKPKTDDEQVMNYDKLYYRMPEVVVTTIRLGNEKMYESRKMIYQFGNIMQLPANYIIGK